MTLDEADQHPVVRVRVRTRTVSARYWLKAHFEAYDHVAVVSDGHDEVVEVSGPWCMRDEINAVIDSLARTDGVMRLLE